MAEASKNEHGRIDGATLTLGMPYARPVRREADAHRALAAGVRELVNGKWVRPAPDYFQYMARTSRA